MKKINVKTETYELDNNFRVDIVTEGNHAEAWIYNAEYGIKTLIFAVNLKENNQTMEDFMAMVENSLDEEIEFYTEDYVCQNGDTHESIYSVEYKLHKGGQVHQISFLANNKEDAYDKAVYKEIPEVTGEYPYSAWVYGVTYQNGSYRRFNTHEGMPY